ncbi:acyl-CoA N-acyltransferase [Rhizoclosmatium globosum]|uniref:Acyl-CoA N-acyltransferase n=1 Tax=Rhizoclosmatium globosum TaxID=329046 RepID=A0A1Y2CG27_9FUNG|nr:acyl-CoA N-acyltransferase [Rhizoclosmatium globosum]|eukprot:ORY45867.1 acyl-CoA N-acyltransferase [Rhizoclosmatium globosum]
METLALDSLVLSAEPGPVKSKDAVLSGTPGTAPSSTLEQVNSDDLSIAVYSGEDDLHKIMNLIESDLSEPYTIYTYRYFLVDWPHLSFLALINNICVGVIVCKLEPHRNGRNRGYLAMLAVKSEYRKQGIGRKLIVKAVEAMVQQGADEVVLETEITNKGAQSLYEGLGFIRDKRMGRYYLNGNDAYRLKLVLK